MNGKHKVSIPAQCCCTYSLPRGKYGLYSDESQQIPLSPGEHMNIKKEWDIWTPFYLCDSPPPPNSHLTHGFFLNHCWLVNTRHTEWKHFAKITKQSFKVLRLLKIRKIKKLSWTGHHGARARMQAGQLLTSDTGVGESYPTWQFALDPLNLQDKGKKWPLKTALWSQHTLCGM